MAQEPGLLAWGPWHVRGLLGEQTQHQAPYQGLLGRADSRPMHGPPDTWETSQSDPIAWATSYRQSIPERVGQWIGGDDPRSDWRQRLARALVGTTGLDHGATPSFGGVTGLNDIATGADAIGQGQLISGAGGIASGALNATLMRGAGTMARSAMQPLEMVGPSTFQFSTSAGPAVARTTNKADGTVFVDHIIGAGGSNSLGVAETRRLIEAIIENNPFARSIEAMRTSGARAKAVADGAPVEKQVLSYPIPGRGDAVERWLAAGR